MQIQNACCPAGANPGPYVVTAMFVKTCKGHEAAQDLLFAMVYRLPYVIQATGVRKPDGSVPGPKWLPAVFNANAEMHGYDITCGAYKLVIGPRDCKKELIPDGADRALGLMLSGTPRDVERFVQTLCDMTSMTCYVMRDEKGRRTLSHAVEPNPETADVWLFDPKDFLAELSLDPYKEGWM